MAKRCAAGEAIEILQEKWVLHIVRSLLSGARGFNELGREVGGCNPTTLTQRLGRLEGLGLVSRTVHSVTPPRCSYALTSSGRALHEVIDAIQEWADEHLERLGPEGDPPRHGDRVRPAANERATALAARAGGRPPVD